MKRTFSLRRRLVLSLLGVFLLGVAATAIFYRWELQEIKDELRHLPTGAVPLNIQFNEMVEGDIEFLGYILIPFTVVAMGVILIITQWSLRGLRRTSRHASQIDINRLDRRLDLSNLPDEIVPLVRAVNGTLDRLATAYIAEQRLTADAAHELRTPLAVLQTRLQTAKLDGVTEWPAIERDLAQLQRVVAQILDLARKESRQGASEMGNRLPVNLARTLREAAAQMLPLAERMNRTIEMEAPDRIMVLGSVEDLRDMLRNLLENAVYHGGGAIRGSVARASRDGGMCAVVVVADDGEGVSESLHEAMFERFRKLSPHSNGAGLGLAIVRRVARDHGGDVRFVLGRQCTVEITLPLLSEEQALNGLVQH